MTLLYYIRVAHLTFISFNICSLDHYNFSKISIKNTIDTDSYIWYKHINYQRCSNRVLYFEVSIKYSIPKSTWEEYSLRRQNWSWWWPWMMIPFCFVQHLDTLFITNCILRFSHLFRGWALFGFLFRVIVTFRLCEIVSNRLLEFGIVSVEPQNLIYQFTSTNVWHIRFRHKNMKFYQILTKAS